MFDQIKRPYKEESPENTIDGIKEILSQLSLFPYISFNANPYPQVFSVSLELKDEEGGFRANGKGRNESFAVASAYAEFMERMQNGLFAILSRTILCELKDKNGFYYFPDEKYLNMNDLIALPEAIQSDLIKCSKDERGRYYKSILKRLKENNIPGLVSVPFREIKNKKLIYLPFNLLLSGVGSNGMASGNSITEATFQAICELIERWGAAQIFYNKITPPSISRNFLKLFKDEFNIISNIEANGKYKVTVKDFSAKLDLPAVGIIIKNIKEKTYRLNVGSDTSFQIALSRCLTEIYQGMKDDNQFDNKLLLIPKKDQEYFLKDDELSIFKRFLEFSKFTKDGSGVFPASLFKKKSSYTFNKNIYKTHNSYQEEVEYLISLIHNKGYSIFIRNVSFLGFPSVFVYIPGVSSQGRKSPPSNSRNDLFAKIRLDRIENLLFRLKICTNDELQCIAKILEQIDHNISIMELFNIKLKNESPWNSLNVAFILTLIWYKLGKLTKAKKNLTDYMKTRNDDQDYYKIVKQFINFKIKGREIKDFETYIDGKYDYALVKQVVNDLLDSENVFKFIKLPSCPNCSTCQLTNDCLTKYKILLAKKFYARISTKVIDQSQDY